MKEINLSHEYLRIAKKIKTLRIIRDIRELENLENALYVFQENCKEILELFDYYYAGDLEKWIKLHNKKHDNFLLEFQRLFHNLLSSLFTLIEHSTVFKKQINNEEFRHFYDDEVKKLISFKVTAFLKKLRIYCQHYKLPLLTSGRAKYLISPDGKLLEHSRIGERIFFGRLAIPKDELRKWDGWSKDAKDFIEEYRFLFNSEIVASSDKIIDLHEVIKEYRKMVDDFYRLIRIKFKELHRDEIDEYIASEREVERIIDLMKDNPKFCVR